MFVELREQSTRFFIKKLVLDYLGELKTLKLKPFKLYLDHDNSQLLVWAEIKEDDEVTEMGLYRAEAKANAKNYQHGVHISSTILEDVDLVSVPPHYKNIIKTK